MVVLVLLGVVVLGVVVGVVVLGVVVLDVVVLDVVAAGTVVEARTVDVGGVREALDNGSDVAVVVHAANVSRPTNAVRAARKLLVAPT